MGGIERHTVYVDYDAKGTYTYRFQPGEDPHVVWQEPGPSFAFALRELANRLERAGKYGSDEELLGDLGTFKKDVDCKYCGAPIFFASVPGSGKSLAFDVEPVMAETVKGTRVAGFGSRLDPRGKLRVVWAGPQATGPAAVPHPVTCGRGGDAPLNRVLKERWQERHKQFEISEEKKNDVIEGLKQMAKEMDNANF